MVKIVQVTQPPTNKVGEHRTYEYIDSANWLRVGDFPSLGCGIRSVVGPRIRFRTFDSGSMFDSAGAVLNWKGGRSGVSSVVATGKRGGLSSRRLNETPLPKGIRLQER